MAGIDGIKAVATDSTDAGFGGIGIAGIDHHYNYILRDLGLLTTIDAFLFMNRTVIPTGNK